MSLYDDALTEYMNRTSNNQFTYMGNPFYVYDFINNPAYLGLYDSACQDTAASFRALVLPNIETPLSSTSGGCLSLLDTAYNLAQQINDGYLAIVNQITVGTITLTAQIVPNWNTFDATYVNPRTIVPTNEALYNLILAIPIPPTRSWAYTSRSLNSAFQISVSQDCEVVYSVDISCTLSLTSGASGTVILETATNSGFTTGVHTIAQATNSNTGTLAIGLNLTQIGTAVLKGIIPTSNWVRLRTVNNTATPTFTYQAGQEVLI